MRIAVVIATAVFALVGVASSAVADDTSCVQGYLETPHPDPDQRDKIAPTIKQTGKCWALKYKLRKAAPNFHLHGGAKRRYKSNSTGLCYICFDNDDNTQDTGILTVEVRLRR